MKCPGVPPAEHSCPNLDIRESTVPARSKCEVLGMEPRIGRRIIMCMLLIEKMALIWNLLGH
jgi:hypothetical protein